MTPVDIVITYVDCDDKSWQEEYNKYSETPYNPVRFRSWGTIKYILRGIEMCMPWIRNVYLVVMSETQVPEYIDKQKVHIVYHKEFMPQSQLPCFSSNPIETYMWRIPGLAERFIYFNDDMIPLRPTTYDDFFTPGGKIRCTQIININPEIKNVFHKIRKNCTDIALKAANVSPKENFVISQRHGPQSMIKTYCRECFIKAQKDIESGLTPIRSATNICQYVYTNYMMLKNRTDRGEKPSSLSYIDFKKYDISQACSLITNPAENFICINDTKDVGDKYNEYVGELTRAFEQRFPTKSKYEI